TNPRWTNISSPSEGTSGTEINLNNNISVNIQETITLTLTYANDSGVYFNLNDMTIVAKVGYTYAYGVSTGYSDPNEMTFNTTITAYQTYTQTRYMRSDNQLGTTQSVGFQTLNERSPRWSGSLSCSWYIEVWVRQADSTMIPLSSGKAALVTRSIDGSGLQSSAWACPNYNLDSTDAIVVRVYMEIGSDTFGPVEFVTEQLGAEDLVGSTWTVWYHTERDYDSRWNQDRTTGIFSWGDTIYNSRVENFKFTALPGAGSPIRASINHGSNELIAPYNQRIVTTDNFLKSASLYRITKEE
ncbi:MAG: hypothetical protein JSV04_10650, partial [Candidatus Heimdallarchaeota archaeon]